MKRHYPAPYDRTLCGKPGTASLEPTIRLLTCLRCTQILLGKAEIDVIVANTRAERERDRFILISNHLRKLKSQK